MKLTDYLTTKTIIPSLKASSKEDVIIELINLFKDNDVVSDLNKVKDAVLEREKIMSTGVGKNFAVPHGKTNAVSDIICAFGKSDHPIDFQALDGQPVYLFFLLVGRDDLVSQHIKLLSRISRIMTNDSFREKLLKAKNENEIINLFRTEEESFFDM